MVATESASPTLSEPLPVGPSASPPNPGSLALTAELQIIASEQWALISTRSLIWNESFSRANMFLAALSGAIVALALLAQATSFGRQFLWLSLVILSVVLFLGVATFSRLVAANREDVLWVRGLNRLRHATLERAPQLSPYFVSAAHDDDAGVLASMGAPPTIRALSHHVLMTTPAVVGVIDAVLCASVVATLGLLADLATEISAGLGITTFVVVAALLAVYQLRTFPRGERVRSVRFPTPVRHEPEERRAGGGADGDRQ
jgi:hypothetical protein